MKQAILILLAILTTSHAQLAQHWTLAHCRKAWGHEFATGHWPQGVTYRAFSHEEIGIEGKFSADHVLIGLKYESDYLEDDHNAQALKLLGENVPNIDWTATPTPLPTSTSPDWVAKDKDGKILYSARVGSGHHGALSLWITPGTTEY